MDLFDLAEELEGLDVNDLTFTVNLGVKKIRGRNEFDVYKNYVHDLPQSKLRDFLCRNFNHRCLKTKDDDKSVQARKMGNQLFEIKDYDFCLNLYTKSLRYATYNQEAYSIALANRSAVYFALGEYQNCIRDINLCLEANYPRELKPKVYFRKAQSFQKLGEISKMHETIDELSDFIDNSPSMQAADSQKYKDLIVDLIKAKVIQKKSPEYGMNFIPTYEKNPAFLNASDAVTLKYNKNVGRHVTAKRDIAQGDVLFVEKAYAFSPVYVEQKLLSKSSCQYCLMKLTYSIPCKSCVKHLFCSEKCRDDAWNEFHQWECLAMQADLFPLLNNEVLLPLRIIFKAARTGFPTISSNMRQDLIKYGSEDDNYPYVYKMYTHFEATKKKKIVSYAANAAVLVYYLRHKTTFFDWLKSLPIYANQTDVDLQNKIGGLLIRHSAHVECNTLAVKSVGKTEISRTHVFRTILPSIMMMSHSCVPNIAYYFVGDTVVVKAMNDIKMNEEICYAYLDLTYSNMARQLRQKVLSELWHFKCRCQACRDIKMNIDAFDSYLCIKCQGPASRGFFDLCICTCLECHHKFRIPENVAQKEILLDKYLTKFKTSLNITDGNRCLEICRSIFSPSHEILCNIHLAFSQYHMLRCGNLKQYIKYGKLVMESGYQRFGKSSVESSIYLYGLLLTIGQVLLEREWAFSEEYFPEFLQEAKSLLEEAKTLFSLHHPFFLPYIQKIEALVAKAQREPTESMSWICEQCCRDYLCCCCGRSQVNVPVAD